VLTKDITSKPTNHLWAVVRNGRSNHEKTFEDINPSRISYVKRANEYQYATTYLTSFDPNAFTRTFSGKTYGFLVYQEHLSRNDAGDEIVQKQYFVVKARDFVGDAKEYQDAWVIEQARLDAEAEVRRIAQEQRDAEYNRRKAIADAKDAQANEQAQNTADKIAKFIEQLLGSKAREMAGIRVSADGQWQTWDDGAGAEKYIITQKGKVELPVQEFQRLMNKFIELNNN
jgi:hypothetical protein